MSAILLKDVKREGTTSPFAFLRFARQIPHSVAAKLFAVVFLVLLLNLGVLGCVNVRLHRRHLESARLRAAERISDIVRRSTSYYMLRNDRDALAQIIETIGQGSGIARVRITDAAGRVGFSTERSEIGHLVHIAGAIVPLQQTRIFETNGARQLSVITPILNTASCSSGACHAHPESEQLLGTLELNLSLAEADADVRKASLQFVSYSALAILLTLSTIGLLVWHFVHEPVQMLRDGTILLGRGDLGMQIPVLSNDELGHLARSFNTMSSQLRHAREESNAWQHTLEERVQSKTAELRRAHDQMIQAEKLTSLGKLAAVVAHEINNPLSGILTYAKLLRKWIERGDSLEAHAPDMRDSLQLIEHESRRCGEIVRNLLTFARVQPMNISDFDVNRIVHATMKLVEHKLELGNIAAHLELAGNLPPLRGDAGQIEQLFLAIIMNAIEAMPREGNLTIATRAQDESIVVRIEDDGAGIPADLLPRLFEPFMTTKEEGKGVGLGLAISKAIVDRHGGAIDVQSEVGRGTAFTITLPCMHPENRA
ncbi:MAG TPA: ATP-binding protein [Thermoanaerobaculia bacterium]|nr:ATP-binding protein [Thermoanaerobaculia bacterium]